MKDIFKETNFLNKFEQDLKERQYNPNKITQQIIDWFIERDKAGRKKYGKSIEDGIPPTGSWKLEIIQELLDAIQYSFRLNVEQQKEINSLKEEIYRLKLQSGIE